MKPAQSTSSLAHKIVPKTVSGRSTHKGQSKKRQGNGPTREELVRMTAYSFYEARHGIDGSDLDDWLRAEAHVDHLGQSESSDSVEDVSTRAGLND
jgi:hypothetical protein